MESNLIVAVAGALAMGVVLGLIVGRVMAARERSALKHEAAAARAELETLRTATADHFNRAGEIFADLTERYVSFYRHLARGAESLANGRSPKFPDTIVVPATADEESTTLLDS